MKKLLPFILTLSLNASLAQDTLPFKKRFYLELNGGIGYYRAGMFFTYGHTIYSPSGEPHTSVSHGVAENTYIAGTVAGFYKYRWIKAGLFYQGGWPKDEVFQHSINVGAGFNSLGGLKKSSIWLGPFISIGGIVPFNGRSYIGTYRLDVGLDLYVRNFHIGYRHSWWDEARTSELDNMKIDYLEIGYAIPLRKRESRETWSSSDEFPVKKRFFIELDGLFGMRSFEEATFGFSLATMYRDRFFKLALNLENIDIIQNSLLLEAGFNTLAKARNKKWWFGPVLSGGINFDFYGGLSLSPRIGGGMDLYFKNFHLGYRQVWSLYQHFIDRDKYIKLGYTLPLRKRHDQKQI